jgi:hypothetical protein
MDCVVSALWEIELEVIAALWLTLCRIVGGVANIIYQRKDHII